MPNIEPIHEFVFSDHVLSEMARRQITEDNVKTVLAKPEQMEMVREGRAVYQSRLEMGEPPKIYLLRIFVDIRPCPAVCGHCLSNQQDREILEISHESQLRQKNR